MTAVNKIFTHKYLIDVVKYICIYIQNLKINTTLVN